MAAAPRSLLCLCLCPARQLTRPAAPLMKRAAPLAPCPALPPLAGDGHRGPDAGRAGRHAVAAPPSAPPSSSFRPPARCVRAPLTAPLHSLCCPAAGRQASTLPVSQLGVTRRRIEALLQWGGGTVQVSGLLGSARESAGGGTRHERARRGEGEERRRDERCRGGGEGRHKGGTQRMAWRGRARHAAQMGGRAHKARRRRALGCCWAGKRRRATGGLGRAARRALAPARSGGEEEEGVAERLRARQAAPVELVLQLQQLHRQVPAWAGEGWSEGWSERCEGVGE